MTQSIPKLQLLRPLRSNESLEDYSEVVSRANEYLNFINSLRGQKEHPHYHLVKKFDSLNSDPSDFNFESVQPHRITPDHEDFKLPSLSPDLKFPESYPARFKIMKKKLTTLKSQLKNAYREIRLNEISNSPSRRLCTQLAEIASDLEIQISDIEKSDLYIEYKSKPRYFDPSAFQSKLKSLSEIGSNELNRGKLYDEEQNSKKPLARVSDYVAHSEDNHRLLESFSAQIDSQVHYKYSANKSHKLHLLRQLQKSVDPALKALKICLASSDHGVDLGVYQKEDSKTMTFSPKGVIRCKKHWICPNCQAIYAEAQRAKLQAIKDYIEIYKEETGIQLYCSMITKTLPHQLEDKLSDLLLSLKSAHRYSKQGRSWQTLKKAFKIHGFVSSFEVLYGKNGWHPHIHEIIVSEVPLKDHEERLFKQWQRSFKYLKQDLPQQIGFRVSDHENTLNYCSKWGLEDELTKLHEKQFGSSGLVPNALILDHLDLYIEYAEATHGLSRIQWSRKFYRKVFEHPKLKEKYGHILDEDTIFNSDHAEVDIESSLQSITYAK